MGEGDETPEWEQWGGDQLQSRSLLSQSCSCQHSSEIKLVEQGLATYGSRARCGSFDGCIWLAAKILIIIYIL